MESLDKQFEGKNLRDFEEITLAIALLGGLLAFLLKLINYFNENIIYWRESTQSHAYFLVGALIFEFIIIFLFFILKGIVLSTNKRRRDLEDITAVLFKTVFIYPFLWFVTTILLLLFYYINQSNYINNYIYYFLIFIIDYILFVELMGKEELKNALDMVSEKITSIKLKQLIVLIMIILIFSLTLKLYSDLLLVAPSILLMGSFSMEEFTQPIEKYDILTFTIKETGLTYSRNYISLYRLNAENNSLSESDNITLPIQHESKNKSMFGDLHDKGLWYININTSSLREACPLVYNIFQAV